MKRTDIAENFGTKQQTLIVRIVAGLGASGGNVPVGSTVTAHYARETGGNVTFTANGASGAATALQQDAASKLWWAEETITAPATPGPLVIECDGHRLTVEVV